MQIHLRFHWYIKVCSKKKSRRNRNISKAKRREKQQEALFFWRSPQLCTSFSHFSVLGSFTKLLDSVEKQEAKEQWKGLRGAGDKTNLKGWLKGKKHLGYKVKNTPFLSKFKEKKALFSWKWVCAHGVWKSQKKSHSTLRAKRATFIFELTKHH